MSFSNCKRSSPNAPQTELKHRVITCLNKLSDRDTLAVATTELESIAKNLTTDSFSPFLTCLSTTDSSEKSPVRRQCVRLIGLLSAEHGDALSPHVSKMLAAVLRRLRDPDSAVRSACVEAVSSMASRITKSPFSSFSKPLIETILHEQDYNLQIGSALCLAAAIEASPDAEPAELRKLLPRLLKLVKSDSFKAKPALLSLFGSIASVGGASNSKSLSSLVPCLVELLGSEDWAVRKAAAEALVRLALAEKSSLSEFKSSSLATLESRRFDKVKVVREAMTRAMELWKDVPGVSDRTLPQPQSALSMKDTGSRSPAASEITPQAKKTIPTGILSSPISSSAIPSQKRSDLKDPYNKPIAPAVCTVDSKRQSEYKFVTAASKTSLSNVACEDVTERTENGTWGNLKPETETETRRVLFNRTSDEKNPKFGGLRFGSRVVPFHENNECELDVTDDNATEDIHGNYKEYEDLNLIRKQLGQIERQQSSLLDLLQRFIGSSQSGMNSLETRVNGIEKALDEMSHDFAVSTGRISSANSSGNTCCMLPGAGFLSPKFWRTDGHNSRLSFSAKNQSSSPRQSVSDKDVNIDTLKLYSPRKQHQNRITSVVNPSRGSLEPISNRMVNKNNIRDGDRAQVFQDGGVDGASSLMNCLRSRT